MKHKKNRPDQPVRAYPLPAKAPVAGREDLDQLLFDANQLYNRLIALRREHRQQYTALLYCLDPPLAPLDARIDALYEERAPLKKEAGEQRMAAGTRNTADTKRAKQITDLDKQIAAAKKERSARIKGIKEADEATLVAFWVSRDEVLRAEGRNNTLHGLTREDVFKDARASSRLKFRKFCEGQSKAVFRIKTGRPYTWAEICDGKWAALRLESPQFNYKQGANAHWVRWFSLNLGRRGSPQWVTLPVAIYREIPPDALVSRVFIQCLRGKYSVQLITEHPTAFTQVASGTNVVCTDLNYRQNDGGLDVASWVGSDGHWGHVRFAPTYMEEWKRVEAIQSHRDRAFNTLRDEMLGWKALNLFPAPLQEALTHAHQWRQPRKLIRLIQQWQAARFDRDEPLLAKALEWLKDEQHLARYQEGLRTRLRRTRKQWQLNLAATFRKMGYGTVLLDGIGLKKLGTKPPVELADQTFDTVRHNKSLACHSVLQTALKRSGMLAIKAGCAYSSRTCSKCGHRAKASRDVVLTCPACGHSEHRDLRGALNPLQAHLKHPVTLTHQEPDIVLGYRGARHNRQARRERYENRIPGRRSARRVRDRRRENQYRQPDRRAALDALPDTAG